MSGEWVATVASGLLAGLGCLGVPTLIRSVPEPVPDPEAAPDDPVKEPYAAIAATPALILRTALVGAAAGVLVGAVLGWSWSLLVVLPLVPIGVALAVIDWRTRLLPTRLVAVGYAVAVIGVAVATAAERDVHPLERAALAWLVIGGAFFLLWWIHPAGLGYGDVRLSGVLGIALGYLGWPQVLLGIWAGFLLGGVVGGALSVLHRDRRRKYPFGPFMLLGALIGIAWGPTLLAR